MKATAIAYAEQHGFRLEFNAARKRIELNGDYVRSYGEALTVMHRRAVVRHKDEGASYAKQAVAAWKSAIAEPQPEHAVKPWLLTVVNAGRTWHYRAPNYAGAVTKLRQGFSDKEYSGQLRDARAAIAYCPFPVLGA